ncbi:MAG: hypothetical protein L0H31_06160, partial [Nocardioidaceae bacterium]|nr:hypothetical protein [Nocardioidaceae bacterium]
AETADESADEDRDPPPAPDLPTEAGMPVFEGDDVQWLRTRSTPPAPPPPFEDLPERPLFAPESPGSRRPPPELGPPPLSGAMELHDTGGYWPWEPTHPGSPTREAESEQVPGRSWLRLAMGVGIAVALLVAIAIAFNLGRGRDALGGEDPDPSDSPSRASGPLPVFADVTARDFDPLGGDGAENSDDVPNAFDGDPDTTWSTQTYVDQLGPSAPSLKSGVGLLLDLGEVRTVGSLTLQLDGGESQVALFAYDEEPSDAPSGAPVAKATGEGELTLVPAGAGAQPSPVRTRYLVLWWTSLPSVSGGFGAKLAEVVVRAER